MPVHTGCLNQPPGCSRVQAGSRGCARRKTDYVRAGGQPHDAGASDAGARRHPDRPVRARHRRGAAAWARGAGGRGRGRPRLRGAADGDRAARRGSADHRDRHLARAPGGDPLRRGRAAGGRTGAAGRATCRTAASCSPTAPRPSRRPTSCSCACRRPVDEERRPEPVALERACEAVVRHARAGQTFVLTSTSYVGRHPRAAGRAAARARAAGRRGGVRGLRPGAHRPRRRRARPAEHPAGHRGRQRELPPAGLDAAQPHLLGAAPGLLARGRRDGQALREHLPGAQHRALVRDRRGLPRARARPRGGDRGRRLQAVRVHGPLPLGGRRRPLHRRRSALPDLPLERAWTPGEPGGGGHAQARRASRTDRPARSGDARRRGPRAGGLACPRRGRFLQARRRRLPRGAGDRDHLPAAPPRERASNTTTRCWRA